MPSPINPSLWIARSHAFDFPPLNTDLEVDVAVVGGGITGLTAALVLQEQGARVAVLEARGIATGTTGYSTAKITSQHGLIYSELMKRHGEEVAGRYARANQTGVEKVGDLVLRFGIDCDFSPRDAFVYAEKSEQLPSLQAEVEAAQQLGLPAAFVSDTDLPFPVAGAMRFTDQAQLDSAAYTIGLARAFAGAGGLIVRGRARGVDDRSPCVVSTDTGHTLTAPHVFVATLLPFLDRGGFFAKAHPSRSYALALEVDDDPPRGMYVSAGSPTRSLRSAYDGEYVVVAGDSHKTGQGGDTRNYYDELERWARETFSVRTVAHRWSAQDYIPVDRIPFVGRQLPGSNVLVATGFQKWGLTNATAAAIMVADIVAGRDNEWLTAFDATRQRSTIVNKTTLKENVGVAKRFFRDRLAVRSSSDPASLAPGEGGIVDVDGRPTAAYRDDHGRLHTLSPKCTHLGCLVSFNRAERSWDCPCHGSRFDVDGAVLAGPATAPLEERAGAGDTAR